MLKPTAIGRAVSPRFSAVSDAYGAATAWGSRHWDSCSAYFPWLTFSKLRSNQRVQRLQYAKVQFENERDAVMCALLQCVAWRQEGCVHCILKGKIWLSLTIIKSSLSISPMMTFCVIGLLICGEQWPWPYRKAGCEWADTTDLHANADHQSGLHCGGHVEWFFYLPRRIGGWNMD